LNKDISENLIKTYGDRAFDVLKLAKNKPELLERIVRYYFKFDINNIKI
jgi:hypothetical protein